MIALYQIIPELDNNHLMFRELDCIKIFGDNAIPAELYENVYIGEVNANSPKDIFRIFNLKHPKDYRGRSLSVSDVIEIQDVPDSSHFYFCDPIGFTEVEFNKRKAMRPIINHDFLPVEIIRHGDFELVFAGASGIETTWCSQIVLTRCQYTQCQLGYRLSYLCDGLHERVFLNRPTILLVHNGVRSGPKNALYEDPGKWHKRKFAPFDEENFLAVKLWCIKQGIEFEEL